MANLYEITTEYQDIMNILEQNGGELTDELSSRLEVTEANVKSKIEGYAWVIKNFEANQQVRDVKIAIYLAQISALKSENDKDANSIERLKDSITSGMKTFGMDEYKTPLFRVSFRKSESVNIFDESLLPKFCWKTETVEKIIPKAEIKKMIEEGVEIPGVEIVKKQNLQIK